MSIIESIILGIVQGLSEFLPVSSSGHLELTKYFFGEDGEGGVFVTVALHLATALSTVVIFRKELAQIFKGLFQFKNNEELQFSLKIIVSMVPAAIVGVALDEEIKQLFDSQILLVGAMLFITGLLLFLADRAKSTSKKVGFIEAIIIGISQAIAILPGISRSGATISTSVLLGIDRDKAARFSFLMVVPLIFAKVAKDILDYVSLETEAQKLEATGGVSLSVLAFGFVAAFLTGLFACNWMISLVKRSNLKYFSYYCFAVGAFAVIASIV